MTMTMFRNVTAAAGFLLIAAAIGGSEMHIATPISSGQYAVAFLGTAIAVAAVWRRR